MSPDANPRFSQAFSADWTVFGLGEDFASAGVTAELAGAAFPDDDAADVPLPWDEMALITMPTTITAPMPAKTFRTVYRFRRRRGGCGP
jgi:hypothetical protein